MPDRDAHRDMGDRFTKNAFSRCATAFPHVADCFRFLVPAAAATVPIRATRRWTGGPPCFWPLLIVSKTLEKDFGRELSRVR